MGIVDIVSKYVQLNKVGSRFVGLCPFHDEKSPSFTIFEDTDSFYCFGCGEHGDSNNFEAKLGIVPYSDNNEGKKYLSRINQAYEEVFEYLSIIFKHTEKGEKYRSYFLNRGYSREFLEKIMVGCFQSDRNDYQFLKHVLEDYGLSVEDFPFFDDNRMIEDSYIIFPLYDKYNKIVSFTGRNILDSEIRYLFLKNTDYLRKSELFYKNFDESGKHRSVIVVEGVFDVLRLNSFGINNVISFLGSSISFTQSKYLEKFKKVILMFDSDRAGKKAIESYLKKTNKDIDDIYVYSLPENEDPDSYFYKNPLSVSEDDVLKKSVSALDYLLSIYSPSPTDSDVSDKKYIMEDLSKFISPKDTFLNEILLRISKHIDLNLLTTNEIFRKSNKVTNPFDFIFEKIDDKVFYFKCNTIFYLVKEVDDTYRILLEPFEKVVDLKEAYMNYDFDSGENIIVIMKDMLQNFYDVMEKKYELF